MPETPPRPVPVRAPVSVEEAIVLFILDSMWEPGLALESVAIRWRKGRLACAQEIDATELAARWEGLEYSVTEQTGQGPDSEPDMPDTAPDTPPLTRLQARALEVIRAATRPLKADAVSHKMGRGKASPHLRGLLRDLVDRGLLWEPNEAGGYWPKDRPIPSRPAA